jgi:hypothetical protein
MVQAASIKRKSDADLQEERKTLSRLILKLRWMGNDTEADQLCHRLDSIAHEECVPTGPGETD